MMFQQFHQLAFHCKKIARLDFDEQIAAHDVNVKAVEGHFDGIARLRVPLFQRGVKRAFLQKSDRARGIFDLRFRAFVRVKFLLDVRHLSFVV
jgi:hypothetical protein